MARSLDKLVVIDLESTCWDGAPPPGQSADIIEIGVVTLDLDSLQPDEAASILVRPERSTVSAFCTELTTLTQAQVDEGVSLREATQQLWRRFRTRDRGWASWGDYDRRMLDRSCREQGISNPMGPTHLNVKHLFAVASGLPREEEVATALERLGLSFEGTPHRGVDDARNIAAILAELLRRLRNDR